MSPKKLAALQQAFRICLSQEERAFLARAIETEAHLSGERQLGRVISRKLDLGVKIS